jgi:2-oxoisovalerate dehydrogenase E2 component (dihydrolipoyl transacylase)
VTSREFMLPDLGEGLAEAEIVRWLVAAGDHVSVDQPVAEVETAKATVEVPSPYAGLVTELAGAEGTVVRVGTPLIIIDDEAHAGEAHAGEAHADEAHAGETEPAPANSGNVLVGYGTAAARKRPLVSSPLVRRMAREHGVSLASVTGSGPGGLITKADIRLAIAAVRPPVTGPPVTGRPVTDPSADGASAPPPPPPAPAVPPGNAPRYPPTMPRNLPQRVRERRPLRGDTTVFVRSRTEIPDATTWVDVDATELTLLRAELSQTRPVGLLALIARFAVAGLGRHPALNSRVDTDAREVVVFDGVNLGFAAQTDRGLVVPVLRDASRLSANAIHDGLGRLAAAARAGTLALGDLTGGTFTVNNYGVFGVDGAAPIINFPETAILGVGRLIKRPWAVDDTICVRTVGQLSLTFDHRVCDGGTAAAFLRFVADCVERPRQAIAELLSGGPMIPVRPRRPITEGDRQATERGSRMTTPKTILDARYSDHDAIATTWDATREVLESAELFWISTVRADGRPHVTPLVAVWVDDALHFHTGEEEQKAANLRDNPYVVLTTGCNSWDKGLDVVVEGTAVQVRDDYTLRRLAEAWAAKWDGRWQLDVRDGGFRNRSESNWPSIVFTVTPTKIHAHAKGDPFGATIHTF